MTLLHNPKSDLTHLYFSGVAKRVSQTFMSLFSPLYIFSLFWQQNYGVSLSVLIVLFFYLVVLISKIATMVFAEDLSRSTGFKKIIWISVLPFLANVVFLILSQSHPLFLVFAAVTGGMHAGLYWWGYHGYFVKSGDVRHFGENIGQAQLLDTTAEILVPVLGGILVLISGFFPNFILASVFIVLSVVLLGRDHEKRQKHDVKFKEVYNLIKTHPVMSLAYIGGSFEAVFYLLIWPIFLFILFGRVLDFGAIVGAASFLSALVGVLVGRYIDRQGERQVVAMGSFLLSASWAIRLVLRSFGGYVFAESVANFGGRITALSLQELTYKKAIEAGSAKAILFRETALVLGGVILIATMSLWVIFFGDLEKAFILPAVVSLFPLGFVLKSVRDEKK